MNKIDLSPVGKKTDDCSSSSYSGSDTNESSTSSDNDAYQEEEEDETRVEIKGLFCDKTFDNIKELYKYESEVNNFNLIDVINRYEMTLFDYIKMINYIRCENPDPSLFSKSVNERPWLDDKYMKTSLEDDPALQFDIEEDLDLLDLKPSEINNNVNDQDSKGVKLEQDEVKTLKKNLKQSESKIEELVELVDKLRNVANDLLNKSIQPTSTSETNNDNNLDDSFYANSYSGYSIHLEMLQDKVRTEGYMNAILQNGSAFKDKIVLDVGCGSGILSLFAAKSGAKMVIAVDMSNIINQAVQIAKENGFEDKIVFLKGKMEQVKLPVDKVDIIISEWMGYFLLYESMLDSVLYARDKYLNTNGMVLPNLFEMHLFGVSDEETHNKTIGYWSNVYGFKMNIMKDFVVKDAQILVLDKETVCTDLFLLKSIDCMNVRKEDCEKFESEFKLHVNKDCFLTGIGSSFDTFFNHDLLEKKSSFSTSPFHQSTHWQQTLFQFDEKIKVDKGTVLSGKIECFKNPDYLRSYIVILNILGRVFKYKID